MITQYFITEFCENKNKDIYEDYYVYVNDTDQLFRMKNSYPVEMTLEAKESVLKEGQTLISKENCVNNEFYKKLISLYKEKNFEETYSTFLDNDAYNLHFTSMYDRDSFVSFFNNTFLIEKSFEVWLRAYPSLLDKYKFDKVDHLIWDYLINKSYQYKSFYNDVPINLADKEGAFAGKVLDYIRYVHKDISFFTDSINRVKKEVEEDEKNIFSRACAKLTDTIEERSKDIDLYTFYRKIDKASHNYVYLLISPENTYIVYYPNKYVTIINNTKSIKLNEWEHINRDVLESFDIYSYLKKVLKSDFKNCVKEKDCENNEEIIEVSYKGTLENFKKLFS